MIRQSSVARRTSYAEGKTRASVLLRNRKAEYSEECFAAPTRILYVTGKISRYFSVSARKLSVVCIIYSSGILAICAGKFRCCYQSLIISATGLNLDGRHRQTFLLNYTNSSDINCFYHLYRLDITHTRYRSVCYCHLSVLTNFSYLDNFRYDCKTIFLSEY